MSEITLLRYLLDEAFSSVGLEASNEAQSLMANLATVTPAMWRARPARSVRTIESIALHVGACKVMYADHAFGDRRLTWASPEVQPWPDGEAPMDATLDWLRTSHARLIDHVATLTDADLGRRRYANWGDERETRWLLSILLQHDTYHAGEINHIRSLLVGEDRWNWRIHEGIDPLATE